MICLIFEHSRNLERNFGTVCVPPMKSKLNFTFLILLNNNVLFYYIYFVTVKQSVWMKSLLSKANTSGLNVVLKYFNLAALNTYYGPIKCTIICFILKQITKKIMRPTKFFKVIRDWKCYFLQLNFPLSFQTYDLRVYE